ncbi:YtxH domain-containing protein [Dethiosulfatarculus sandiegensis]|uniref:Oxidoreductase n=1 Tax=Dethiosulfatarculus sandiegensis TaxID=1429043 RepID=A0A0D2JB29_9BACT|nr:YtxH domain-containing protein [Dethiosulfatarculus sandiegensis]KIX15329.1 oxidoreductase [Dethiosulfatarculus sandiegensis]
MSYSHYPPPGAPPQATDCGCQDQAQAGEYYGSPEQTQAYYQAAQYPEYQSQYYYQNQAPSSGVSSWFAVTDSCYLKGMLLGAGVTLLLTNPTVQKTMVRGAVKLWSGVQYGLEEVKEQIQDIKAELSLKADKEEE